MNNNSADRKDARAENLKKLGLSMNQIKHLSKDELADEIKSAYKKMSLICHPDKPGGSQEKFLSIGKAYEDLKSLTQEAYINLISSAKKYREIDDYFTKQTVTIPETGFDLLMQEGVLTAVGDLLKKFQSLPETQKRPFAEGYAGFLSLADALELKRPELHQLRLDSLREQLRESFSTLLVREWRLLIIQLFAEEYLDDFQYRHALAFGDLWPILASRKLLSPIKGLAAIIGSLDLLIRCGARHLLKKVDGMLGLSDENYPISFLSELICDLLSLVVYTPLIFMSCPINSLIRPIARYTGFSPLALIALFSTIGAGIMYNIMKTGIQLSLANFILLTPNIISLVMALYTLYMIFDLAVKLNEKGLPGSLVGCCMLAMVLAYQLVAIYSSPIDFFISQLVYTSFIRTGKKILEGRPRELLPLPNAPVSEEIKSATLQGYKKANQSNLFFNTPKDAEYQNNRSPWQKVASFFGVDLVDEPTKVTLDNPHLMLNYR